MRPQDIMMAIAAVQNDTSDSGSCIKTCGAQPHKVRKYGAGRSRVEETGCNRLLTRALYDTETEPVIALVLRHLYV